MDFQKAVANGTYNKQQIVRVYEPSKIFQAFSQALHWQISLQNSCDAKHVEISNKEKNLAQHIFVSYLIAYLSCILNEFAEMAGYLSLSSDSVRCPWESSVASMANW